MKKDYSQWGEGKMIVDFFGGRHGRFLDIGAYDGIEGSNTRNLSDLGWSGVCVEANPANFISLLHNHRGNGKIECLNAAIVPDRYVGPIRFYDANGQIGTTYPDHKVAEYVRQTYWVAGINAESLARIFGVRFEFVSLDIEGMDLPVLREMGPLLTHTSLICVEDTIPNSAFDKDYYNELMKVCTGFGFTRVVGRTTTVQKSANTLLAR